MVNNPKNGVTVKKKKVKCCLLLLSCMKIQVTTEPQMVLSRGNPMNSGREASTGWIITVPCATRWKLCIVFDLFLKPFFLSFIHKHHAQRLGEQKLVLDQHKPGTLTSFDSYAEK